MLGLGTERRSEMTNVSLTVNCGLDCCNIPDLFGGLVAAERSRYAYVCTPVVHPRLRRRYGPDGRPEEVGFTRSDMLLDTGDWGSRVVARFSPYLSLDSADPVVRRRHEDSLFEEIDHCRGLGVSAAVVTLRHGDNPNLARVVTSHLQSQHFALSFWVQVPMTSPFRAAFGGSLEDDDEHRHFRKNDTDTWKWWSDFHRCTEWDRRISLALELSADLPSPEELARWSGEPVKCLVIPTSVFLTNKRQHPVLSRPHQAFVKQLLERDVYMLVSGSSRHQDISHYTKYLQHLFVTSVCNDPMSNFAKGWEDYLQTPLQPLSDNLDSYTYNVFEKDPVKYDNYQNAVLEALETRYDYPVKCTCGKKKKDAENSNEGLTPKEEEFCECKHSSVIMVLGAGRGPLVRAVLNAAKMADVNVKVYAVEKNPTALVTLQGQQREMWGDKVTVVACDMRKFKPDELADIIVSELLGSFGDNELSPECLDGARPLLKDDGISIPCSYTSYLSPVMCSRLWGFARASETSHLKHSNAHPLETPWVVYQQNKYEIAPPQELFTFTHPCEPGDGSNVDRRRWKLLKFPVEQSCTLHGFTGYFSSVLFREHTLSIVPETHSTSMISWFPIYFPIKSPIALTEGQTIEVNFWRCCDNRKVWYEWNVVSPELQAVHNSSGKSSNMIL